jgi:hypothetical protein
MNLDDQFRLDHLLLKERKCRTCNKNKSLLDDYYLTRRTGGNLSSSYSYECKDCTIKRVTESRKTKKNKPDIPYCPVPRIKDVYPDW